MIFFSLNFLSFVQISFIVIGEIGIFTANLLLSALIGKGGGVGSEKPASTLSGTDYQPRDATLSSQVAETRQCRTTRI
jgi:hypothetical protein